MDESAAQIRQDIEATRDRMSETVEAIAFKADVPARVGDAVRERIETVRGTVNGVVANLTEAVEDASVTARENGGTQRAVSSALEHPLGIALAALAIGFLGGSLLPGRRKRRTAYVEPA